MKKPVLIIPVFLFVGFPASSVFHLEFVDSRLNALVFLSFLASFPVFLVTLFAIKWPSKLSARIPLLIFLLLCSLLATIPASCRLMTARELFTTGNDPSYEKLHELHIDHHYYTCYRANGGATTAFLLDLRREYRLLGLRYYQFLARVDHAYDADFYQENGVWYAKILGGQSTEADSTFRLD
jgi:hypothetical protein